MGRKHIHEGYNVVTDGDISSDVTGSVTSVNQFDTASYLFTWTGTSPVGVLSVEFSNDNSNFYELPVGSTMSVSGNSGTIKVDVNQITFKYLRLKYTATSGTGTANCVFTGTTVGA